MVSIRTKLTLGFGAIMIIVAGIGFLIMTQLTDLGEAIDVILRENHRSVVACQNMKEALERIDSGVLISLNDNATLGSNLITTNLISFDHAFNVEKNNITLPGEKGLVDSLDAISEQYFELVKHTVGSAKSIEYRKKQYYSQTIPAFFKAKDKAQEILILNQENMNQANNRARKQASSAKARMLVVILICGLLSVLFSFLTRVWVLKPIQRLIDYVGDVSKGNLELVLHNNTRDEIGVLSDAFNNMTQVLREKKRSDNSILQRTQQVTKDVISSLPTAIAVIDQDGIIDIATEGAQVLFGMTPGLSVFKTPNPWLPELYQKAIRDDEITYYPDDKGYLQVFNEFKEYFYRPVIVPISKTSTDTNPTGTIILFNDMTQQHEQQELKQSVVSTVSHQLKTPLTALRMSIHLLLDERIGTLNNKQLEITQAAREESERLANIVEDLLSIHRIKNNHKLLEMKLTDPQFLLNEGVIPYISMAKDKGISLVTEIPPGLPFVKVDTSRFSYVLANYITNAVSYTSAGGKISITAREAGDKVRFMVTDTGIGIASEHLVHIFEQFYRVPNSEHSDGAGLGLAIVKEIVQAHGGEVGVESVLNQGSTFWFELPSYPVHLPSLILTPNGGN